MNRQEKLVMIREMLRLIAEGSHNMPNHVFAYYVNHKIASEQKLFYNLIADSFLTLYSFSNLMNENCWSQAATVLRMGMEQIAAVFIMTYEKGALDSYLKLQQEKFRYYNLDENEQKSYKKDRSIKGKLVDYFDYSWIRDFTNDKTYGRDKLMELAHLDEFLVDIDQTLNAFAHGSITIFQFSNDNWDVMKRYGDRICLSCCKLFDFLCCSYKQLIGDEFYSLPLNEIFIRFKRIYKFHFCQRRPEETNLNSTKDR